MAADSAKVMDLGSGRKAGATKNTAPALAWAGFPAATVDKFPGPALVLGPDQTLIHANVHAGPLIEALHASDATLNAMVGRCLSGDLPLTQKLALTGSAGHRHLDLFALPVVFTAPGERRGVLIIARETTLEHNLTGALVDSRQMFKDLITCSADFVWETDAQGIFRYVSAQGGFNYAAHELTGRQADSLLAADAGPQSPFSTEKRINDRVFVLRRGDGSPATVAISATPVLNQRGDWLGARGVARDISAAKQQQSAHRHLQQRHRVVMALATLARDAAPAEKIFTAAATLIGNALDADCWLLQPGDGGFVIVGQAGVSRSGVERTGTFDGKAMALIATLAGFDPSAASPRPTLDLIDGQKIALIPTTHHAIINGAVAVIRPEDTPADFDDHALTLLDEAAEQISLLFELMKSRARIAALSRFDELTNLLNEQAFTELVEQRIAHQARSGTPAVLLVVALDNDEHSAEELGYPFTTAALKQLAERLQNRSRAGDIIARLANDRFALWLEDTTLDGAIHKTRLTILQAQDIVLGRVSGTGSVSVCVGIAECEPGRRNDLTALLARADLALGHAQRQGRGRWAVAPADDPT